MRKFAKVIIDISADAVDRAFTYKIPEALFEKVRPGVRVRVPFGNANTPKTGYVTEVSEEAGYDEAKLKEIAEVPDSAMCADGEMIALAAFLAQQYGSTMNQALKTVLPVKKRVRKNSRRTDPVEVIEALSGTGENAEPAELTAPEQRSRPAKAGAEQPAFFGETSGGAAERSPAEESACGTVSENAEPAHEKLIPPLTKEQQRCTDDLISRYETFLSGKSRGVKPSLLYGVTGSGKTRVYIELIKYMQKCGKQSIVLIPEISLTYQTVRELSKVFRGRVAVLHSRLSEGERYEQYEKARNGQIDVMVGPRSALFTPFERLGLIVIDEEHEGAYHSDTSPRYDAREAARFRTERAGAMLLLGSATPSLLSMSRAKQDVYRLYRLRERAVNAAALPKIHVCDMREELAAGNRSAFSAVLHGLIEEKLQKKEQVMLFINRRGYAGFVSCRSCGYVVKCPHCDVSLTAHNNWYYDRRTGKREAALLSCHYCGHTAPMPKRCPDCQSPYIAPFGTGTQKLEAAVKKEFPQARLLRMDADSTAKKGAHERILSAFAKGEADILLGTQMIVKGHDFPRVTLVGILAADLSLYAPEYDASERTFQLLTQASGRAGRAERPGDVVIQTYDPSHYAVAAAAKQDYEAFYEREMSYRKLLSYPPYRELLAVRFHAKDEALLSEAAEALAAHVLSLAKESFAELIGPCAPAPAKVNDIYRKILYIKHERHDIIIKLREEIRAYIAESPYRNEIQLSYELFL